MTDDYKDLEVPDNLRGTADLFERHNFKVVDCGEYDPETFFLTCVIDDHSTDMALEANRMLDILEDYGARFTIHPKWGEVPHVQVSFDPRVGLWLLDVRGISDRDLRFPEGSA